MSAKITATGRVGQTPELRFTRGTPVLDVSVAATYRKRDKQIGEWADVGEPLWLRATFWRDQAENLANLLQKGDRVSVEGVVTLRTWATRDGEQRTSLELEHARFLGIIPSEQRQPVGVTSPAPMGGSDEDPWGQAAQYPDQLPPF